MLSVITSVNVIAFVVLKILHNAKVFVCKKTVDVRKTTKNIPADLNLILTALRKYLNISGSQDKKNIYIVNLRKTYFLKKRGCLGMRNCAEVVHTMNVNLCSLTLI